MLTNRDSRFCLSLWTERKFRGWDTRTKVSWSFVNWDENVSVGSWECRLWSLLIWNALKNIVNDPPSKPSPSQLVRPTTEQLSLAVTIICLLLTAVDVLFLITCEASQQMMTDEPQEWWHIHHNFCFYFLAGSPASDNSGSIIFPKFAVTNVKWEMIAIGISADLMNGGLRLRKLIWKWNIWYVSLTGKQPSWASLCFPIISR